MISPQHSPTTPNNLLCGGKYIADLSAVEPTPGTALARPILDDLHIVLGCFCRKLVDEHDEDSLLWFLIKVVVADGKMDARLSGHVEGGYALGWLLGS